MWRKQDQVIILRVSLLNLVSLWISSGACQWMCAQGRSHMIAGLPESAAASADSIETALAPASWVMLWSHSLQQRAWWTLRGYFWVICIIVLYFNHWCQKWDKLKAAGWRGNLAWKMSACILILLVFLFLYLQSLIRRQKCFIYFT